MQSLAGAGYRAAPDACSLCEQRRPFTTLVDFECRPARTWFEGHPKLFFGAAVAGALLTSQAHAAPASLIDAANQEGEVVCYTTLIVGQAVRPLVAAFEAAYPNNHVQISIEQGAPVR